MNYDDAHVVDQDEAGPDDACWATVDLADCGQTATTDVGLCDRHLEELAAGNSPAAEAWTDDPRGDTAGDLAARLDEVFGPSSTVAFRLGDGTLVGCIDGARTTWWITR